MPAFTLTLLAGPTIPVPVPASFVDALDSVEVTHTDEGRSGFQLSFSAGGAGAEAATDVPLLRLPVLQPFHRVIVTVTVGARPFVLMDGFITHQQLVPSTTCCGATLVVTGEDVSVMMDLEERSVEHPGLDETAIVSRIVGAYPQLGLVPKVLPPPSTDRPTPAERVPVQQESDLEHLGELAERHGYVFYVAPGPAPGANTAYWGPPTVVDMPQRALSVGMGPMTNVDSLTFRNDALAPVGVSVDVQDPKNGKAVKVPGISSSVPPLSASPVKPRRQVRLRASGPNVTAATARAQGLANRSSAAVTAEGELDAEVYGDVLRARALVDVRGAGSSYDGMYYVKRVTHDIADGDYRQRFTLTREGTGATSPVVVP